MGFLPRAAKPWKLTLSGLEITFATLSLGIIPLIESYGHKSPWWQGVTVCLFESHFNLSIQNCKIKLKWVTRRGPTTFNITLLNFILFYFNLFILLYLNCSYTRFQIPKFRLKFCLYLNFVLNQSNFPDGEITDCSYSCLQGSFQPCGVSFA